MRFVVIPELRGRWAWELRDSASRVLATSAMSFGSRETALASIQEFRTKVCSASYCEVGVATDVAEDEAGRAK